MDPVKPARPWQQLKGLAYGLQQPVLVGTLLFPRIPAVHLLRIERALQSLVDEPIPEAEAPVPAAERLALVFAFFVGSIQRQCRIPVSERFLVRRLAEAGRGALVCLLALPAPQLRASQVALQWSLSTLNRLLVAQDVFRDPQAGRDAIHEALRAYSARGVNRFGIVHAANRLGIPVNHLTADVLVLGTGVHSRWMKSSFTDATPAIGASIAQNKQATAQVLRAAGLPGAIHQAVTSVESALQAARALGFPVVVKPADRDRGEGVAADLRDEPAVASAYEAARKFSAHILVERWAPGFTHRLTVFNGRVIRVTRRIAGGVFGDGRSDLRALVLQAQRSEHQQRQKRRLGKVLLELDDEALGLLQQQGLDTSHIPASGEYVRLRRRDNINAGGANEDVALAAIHPDNLRLAVDAADLLRLDFAGIDLIMDDLSTSWLDAGALICEVNAMPQMRASSDPGIYERVLAEFMGTEVRVPARLSVCPEEPAAREAALRLARASDRYNGVSDRSGLWVDGIRATASFQDGLAAARALLLRKDVRGAVCLMTPKEILSLGLPLDQWTAVDFAAPEAFGDEEQSLMGRVRSLLPGALPDSGARLPSTVITA